MKYTPESRAILEELERRKATKDDPCDSCDGTGTSSNSTDGQPLACAHCLGQGVLLTAQEYLALTGIAFIAPNDDILDADILK
ncbi:MAG: hypothetical protein ABL984_02560 [Pyrinomonadaceae bacterium]